MMATFTFGKEVMDQMQGLKQAFGVTSNSAVITRALALAQLVAAQADDDHTVVLAGKDNKPIKLSLDK